jgi:hypothetical protein
MWRSVYAESVSLVSTSFKATGEITARTVADACATPPLFRQATMTAFGPGAAGNLRENSPFCERMK